MGGSLNAFRGLCGAWGHNGQALFAPIQQQNVIRKSRTKTSIVVNKRSKVNDMKNKTVLLASAIFVMAPALTFAQATTGTGGFSGSVPTTFTITNASNGSLAGGASYWDFSSNMTIGKNGVLATGSDLVFRMRSNADYQLQAQVGSLSGIADGTGATAGSTAKDLTLGDIGFGVTAEIDASGASVVGSRTDTINTGFDVSSGWATASDGRISFSKTLHDIYGSPVQILSGPRISASGDNSSSDNFLLVKVGVAALPQYFTPATSFSGVVTLTISAKP